MYTLYRQSLLRWHHVDQLTPQQLQERFLYEHGQWAHCDHLQTWLKAAAQALPILENNEDIHSHPCGEYVLEQLQQGARPADVVQGLLQEYLVHATVQRVQAYRLYREQRSDYWTSAKLVQHHWEFLYDQFLEAGPLVVVARYEKLNRNTKEVFLGIRTALCEA